MPNILSDLLRIKAIALSPEHPFTFSSGIQSPIYCDNRLTISHPLIRQRIVREFARIIQDNNIPCDVIAGTATAGIPHAAWLADHLNLPMVYVRSSAKAHGKGNQIEGEALPGKQIIVIEDLISTGGSALNAVHALREAGLIANHVLAIFSYQFSTSKAAFTREAISLNTLSNFDNLIQYCKENNQISEQELVLIQEWHSAQSTRQ